MRTDVIYINVNKLDGVHKSKLREPDGENKGQKRVSKIQPSSLDWKKTKTSLSAVDQIKVDEKKKKVIPENLLSIATILSQSIHL